MAMKSAEVGKNSPVPSLDEVVLIVKIKDTDSSLLILCFQITHWHLLRGADNLTFTLQLVNFA